MLYKNKKELSKEDITRIDTLIETLEIQTRAIKKLSEEIEREVKLNKYTKPLISYK